MVRRDIDAFWDRETKNNINENFKELYDKAVTTTKTIDDLVLESGESNMEVVQARAGKPTLNARLNVIDDGLNLVDQQLAQTAQEINRVDSSKANKNEVEEALNNKRDKSVPIGLNDTDSELLAAIEGGEGTSFNLESIPRDYSVTPEKTTFVRSKNLFDGNYIKGGLSGSKTSQTPGFVTTGAFEDAKSAVIEVKQHTTYTISKTPSDRFRVALTSNYPEHNRAVKFIRDEYDDGGDSATEFTFNSENYNYVTIYVTINNELPDFLQIEEGDIATEWYTYGFFITPQAEKYSSIGVIKDRMKDGKVYVNDFTGDGKSDADAIQDAFDHSKGNVVVFNPEKKYNVNKTVTAHASKVRGVEGQNALLEADADIDIFKYVGSKTSGNAIPTPSSGNIELAYSEMKPFINHLRVSSTKGAYVGSGIVFDGTYGLTIDGCHAFNLKHGIKVVGLNRDFIVSNNTIYHCSGQGIFWDNADVHQQNIVGNHISYCKKSLYFLNSNMHNVQIVGNDIESGFTDDIRYPESLIHFYIDDSITQVYEAIHIVGNSLQDHLNNYTQPLLKFESKKEAGIQDLIIGNNQLANALKESLYIEGSDRVAFTGNSIKRGGEDVPYSINLVGSNKNVNISGNNIPTGIQWSAETTKTLIANNILDGFTLPDSDDGKVKVVNNF
ncbi:right-handed parallel beta-helix repeat-containing protein [Oceanobacillus oncorhynchi]|uniref:right-handed parallel beta-helix repeat-containing protein n=1 Tax=Oceanobacillus oncorhynchi TaxID=545501 RepID=UPI001867D2D5|nr:right-handed parallel beta-helix repeat-containing protein [Oceanobacillus oncorhynchi]